MKNKDNPEIVKSLRAFMYETMVEYRLIEYRIVFYMIRL